MTPLRSRILETGTRATFHTLLLVSIFLLVRGHDQPGGGFAGGLIASAAFVLVWVAQGPQSLRLLPLQPESLVAVGLGVSLATAIGGFLAGDALLTSGYLFEVDLAALGPVKLASVLVFDLGIYLVVLGFSTLALERLGDERNEA